MELGARGGSRRVFAGVIGAVGWAAVAAAQDEVDTQADPARFLAAFVARVVDAEDLEVSFTGRCEITGQGPLDFSGRLAFGANGRLLVEQRSVFSDPPDFTFESTWCCDAERAVYWTETSARLDGQLDAPEDWDVVRRLTAWGGVFLPSRATLLGLSAEGVALDETYTPTEVTWGGVAVEGGVRYRAVNFTLTPGVPSLPPIAVVAWFDETTGALWHHEQKIVVDDQVTTIVTIYGVWNETAGLVDGDFEIPEVERDDSR